MQINSEKLGASKPNPVVVDHSTIAASISGTEVSSVGSSVEALAKPINPFQERAILDLLSEAIMVVEGFQTPQSGADLKVAYSNRTFENLVDCTDAGLDARTLSSIFPEQKYPNLYDALHRVEQTNETEEINLVLKSNGKRKHLALHVIPYVGKSFQAAGDDTAIGRQVVCCIRDMTASTLRANQLEDRAIKLIDHAQVLEDSRRALEQQLLGLRKEVRSFEKATRIDPISGLPNRPYFLERGSAEFQRSLRYGHTLSVVVCGVQGYEQIIEMHGQKAADAAITGLGQMCETAYRAGTDIGGRTATGEIAIYLPETDLEGAYQFVERLRAVIAKTPIETGGMLVHLGISIGLDEIGREDHAFLQCLSRARNDCLSNM